MLINRQFGDYVLIRRLAVGGQSEVFLAVKRGPGDYSRPVVIKALPTNKRSDPRYVELFHREAFISSRLAHPHLVNVHNAEVIGSEHCMFMDFIAGQTVSDIAQRGYQQGCPPTLKQVIMIIADACSGLAYAHDFCDIDNRRYSVVHRDVSPQNLMVTYQGDTKVFDFGISRIIGHDREVCTLEGGKFAYMSPEQLQGKQVDPRSDIFSLGVILYELVLGRRLFRRESTEAVIKAVCDEPIAAPKEIKPGINSTLNSCIMKALDRDPFSRYQTAGEMQSDLLSFLGETDAAAIRRPLGAYVTALFKSERSEIASDLQNAPEISATSKPLGSLSFGQLHSGKIRGPATLELDSTASAGLRDADMELQSVEEGAYDKVSQLESRQRLLVTLLLGAILVIAALGYVLQFGVPKFETSTTANQSDSDIQKLMRDGQK